MTRLGASAPERADQPNGIEFGVNKERELTAAWRIVVVTDMVKLRKLTRHLITISPDPSAEASVAKKWVIGTNVRFRTFFGVQNRTKFCHF